MQNPLNTFMVIAAAFLLMGTLAFGHDLSPYRWKNRLLLVFSPGESDPGYRAFDRALSRRLPGVADRDLIVFRVFEKGPSRLGEEPLAPEDAADLRRRFQVAPGRFTVILIGKDGTVKMVRRDGAELQEIFDRIDSMPMRQQEMREKSRSR